LLHPFIDVAPIAVTMTFTADRFSISVTQPNDCAGGTYKINGQEIELANSCSPSPGYLTGAFWLKISDRQIEMTKTSGVYIYTYSLTYQ
jgi:hypothetical protein